MKEVSSRPMAQGRTLYGMAVKCAGVTVKLYRSTWLEEFGPDIGCERRKEKARLFLCQSSEADFGGAYVRSKLNLADNPVTSAHSAHSSTKPPSLSRSLRDYTSLGTLECVNYCTQGMLTAAVSKLQGKVRVACIPLHIIHFIRLVLKKIRVMTIQRTPLLDQLLDPTGRFHQMTSFQGSR